MFCKVKTLGFKGIEGFSVEAEIDVSGGLPAYNIVGLPDAAVKESRDRVVSAIKNCGFKIPSKKITVNLAPAEIKKSGSHFDLPIAVGVLIASGIIKPQKDIRNYVFLGELSLDAAIRSVSGLLPMLITVKENSLGEAVIPIDNALEGQVSGAQFICPKNLLELCSFLQDAKDISKPEVNFNRILNIAKLDFFEVKGQPLAKRAFEIAAAGFHNMIMIGPPGAGKSMLAKRMSGIMPPMTEAEILSATKIYSVAGFIKSSTVENRPFRDPHHTISDVALLGGGQYPKPGEVSLAHNGVLFLDEFPEFSRNAIESLREPLENKKITVSRVKETITYPANFMLIAAANPCPCGYYSHPTKRCVCTPMVIQKYRNKISGPILDRIDLHVDVPVVKYSQWENLQESEKSSDIAARVQKAIDIQRKRNANKYNGNLEHSDIRKICLMPNEVSSILENAMDRLGFSARSIDKIAKISRTIADLSGSEKIKKEHVIEAFSFRNLDKKIIF